MEPGDVMIPEAYGASDVSVQRFRGVRWCLKLTPESAEGLMAGYVGIDDFNRQLGRSMSTQMTAYFHLAAPLLYRTIERLADGYPDPKTGKNTVLSFALAVTMKQAFIVHSGQNHDD